MLSCVEHEKKFYNLETKVLGVVISGTQDSSSDLSWDSHIDLIFVIKIQPWR